MKGLLDIPICCVEDSATKRWLVSPPSGQDHGSPYRPPGSTRYSGNKMKGIAAVGVGRYHYYTMFMSMAYLSRSNEDVHAKLARISYSHYTVGSKDKCFSIGQVLVYKVLI